MTQTFPTTPQVIYDAVSGDSVISATVGEYVLKGGAGTFPAISIITPGQELPSLKSTTGVEIIIHDIADKRRRDYYDSVNIETNWKVFVICWDPATGSEVSVIIDRFLEIFRGSTSVETIATSEGIGALVQTMVLIPSDMPMQI